MRRFRTDDEEDQWDGEDDEFMERIMGDDETVQTIQIELASMDINHKVLTSAMQLLECSWTWKFENVQTKLKRLKEVYQMMSQLLQRQQDTPPAPQEG